MSQTDRILALVVIVLFVIGSEDRFEITFKDDDEKKMERKNNLGSFFKSNHHSV